MSTTITTTTTTPQKWNVEVNSAKLRDKRAILEDDLKALNEKIQAFVQTSVFQSKIAELSKNTQAPFKIELIFENDTIKLKTKDSKIATLTPPANNKANESKAIQETINLVKNIEKHYLNPWNAIDNPKTSLTNLTSPGTNNATVATKETLTKYKVHGIKNEPKKFCYGISPYQLFANVYSLKTSVIDHNTNLNYKSIKDGKKLIEKVNKFKTSDKFQTNTVYDTSDVVEALINSPKSQFPTFTLIETGELSNIKRKDNKPTSGNLQAQLIYEDSRKDTPRHERIFACSIPKTGSTHFDNIISSRLVQTSPKEKRTNNIELNYTKKTTTKFKLQPKQLMIQLDRQTAATSSVSTNAFIEGIPMILDLQKYGAIEIPKDPPVPLELKGFTVHTGRDGPDGHYIAYFKKENPQNKGEYQWFCADDATISIVPENKVIQELGYARNLYYDDTKTHSTKQNAHPVMSYTEFMNESKSNDDKFYDVEEGSFEEDPIKDSFENTSSSITPDNRSWLSKVKSICSLSNISKSNEDVFHDCEEDPIKDSFENTSSSITPDNRSWLSKLKDTILTISYITNLVIWGD